MSMIYNIKNWIAQKMDADPATETLQNPLLSSILPAGTQVVTVSHISLIPSTAVPVTSVCGFPVSGTVYVDSGTGVVYTTSSQLNPLQDLSPEEKQKLKSLEEDRKRETKRAKLDIFKKLPAKIRQDVVDNFIWRDAVAKMNAAEAPKSPEQMELENRDQLAKAMRGYMGGGYSRSDFIDSTYYGELHEQLGGTYLRGLILPKDITPEELMRAHAEATTEEALLETTNTESK